ncbi:XYLOGLUCAN 6-XYLOSYLTRANSFERASE 5-RELATED-RELATED [Salix viminalis]|uniref:XYLOGLUCAN 6-XYLOSYLTRANSFERASE 5-RELATED-RELATED n=1 Tax=Salix viminalis TaxID=40686 RepID=A0A9Q0U238_SALVM|nr:XYLOGLUCAN 6-XYLOSYLTRANSFERASE 5-RELATED-RELATED [Salix viminalis]
MPMFLLRSPGRLSSPARVPLSLVPGHNSFVLFGKKVPCPGQTLLVSFSNSNSSRLGGFNFSDEPSSLAGVDWWRVSYRLGGAASLLSSNLSERGLGSSRAQDRSGLAWVSALGAEPGDSLCMLPGLCTIALHVIGGMHAVSWTTVLLILELLALLSPRSLELKMLDRCLASCQRPMCHAKATLICLFVTAATVLLGTIGAGKFGTDQEQHFSNLRNNFYPSRKHAEPQKVVVELTRNSSSDDMKKTKNDDPNSYASFDINKLLQVDEGEDDENDPDSDKPYSLGPKISDWDGKRAEWLRENPSFPSFVGPNYKPRVLLVTGSSPKPCENRIGDHYLLKSIKNKIDYCRLHGIDIFYNMALLDAEMAGFWAKLPVNKEAVGFAA